MKRLFVGLTLLLFLTACGTSVLPEMQDFMGAFGSKEAVAAAVEKYAGSPKIVPDALKICELGKPIITSTEEKDRKIYCYSAEAKVESCETSETAIGTIRLLILPGKMARLFHLNGR